MEQGEFMQKLPSGQKFEVQKKPMRLLAIGWISEQNKNLQASLRFVKKMGSTVPLRFYSQMFNSFEAMMSVILVFWD